MGIDKKTKFDYYNGNQILGYSDRPFKFVVGNRSAGKSFFWKSYCIKKFLKSKDEFIYIRRFKNDFEDTLTTFFDDVKFKFPDVDFAVKKNKFYICNAVRMLSTIAACGTLKKEIGLRRDSEAFLLWTFPIIPSLPSVPSTDGSFL